jgi:hypothetical protein
MSKEQIGFVHAARRHVRDARALLATSPLQSYHLAGFGPECARKALPGLDAYAKKLGHKVDVDIFLTNLFTALDPFLHRYPVVGWSTRFPKYSQWQPEVRYQADTDPRTQDAAALVSEAEEAVCDVLFALYADGSAPEDAFQ